MSGALPAGGRVRRPHTCSMLHMPSNRCKQGWMFAEGRIIFAASALAWCAAVDGRGECYVALGGVSRAGVTSGMCNPHAECQDHACTDVAMFSLFQTGVHQPL